VNERIKELAEQAGILKKQSVQANIVKNEDGTWTSILEYLDLEHFAELIVRECSNIVFEEGCTELNQDCPDRELYQLSNKIEQHFGFGLV
jgi:hypothetical protein